MKNRGVFGYKIAILGGIENRDFWILVIYKTVTFGFWIESLGFSENVELWKIQFFEHGGMECRSKNPGCEGIVARQAVGASTQQY